MANAGIPFEEIERELMKDEEFVREYERLRPQYEMLSQRIMNKKEPLLIEKVRNIKSFIKLKRNR